MRELLIDEGFNLGSSIASKIDSALFFANFDILGVKIIRIDPLEPNIWLYYVYYDVLQPFFNPKVWSVANSDLTESFTHHDR